MKKVQSAKNIDKTLDELYKRYKQRTTTYDPSREYAEHKSRELLTRNNAPKAHKHSLTDETNIKKYRNGISKNGKYMTEGDFAKYYKETREYTPQSNVELDTTILLHRIDRARYKKEEMPVKKHNDVKRKLKAEAIKSSAKVPEQKPILKNKISKAK